MTGIGLVHLSDLHFTAPGPSLDPSIALELVAETLSNGCFADDLVLLISGDLTFRGNEAGFDEALYHLQSRLLDKVEFDRILVCPGNHDITASRDFNTFNRFAFALTNDPHQRWNANSTACVVTVNDVTFVLGNSSHHGDHSFGSVELAGLRRALELADGDVIVVLHHSPISSLYGGAGLENAHELLSLVCERRSVALLHGDTHSDAVLIAGERPTVIAGVGSLGFSPDPNMNNQFAYHEVAEGRVSRATLYRYFKNRNRFEAVELRGLQ